MWNCAKISSTMLSCAIFVICICAVHNYVVFEHVKPSIKNEDVEKVHIVSMNHLDVGFNHYLDDVLNLYFTEYFPRAINLSEALRQRGYVETFIYTTHPWLVSMYVDCPAHLDLISAQVKCPSETELSRFRAAVSRGDITWHAGPMNMQFEFMDQSMAEFALFLSQSLDERFSLHRSHRTMSQRDVPGLTHALIPILVSGGVVALSVGVNAASAPPAVPRIFNWYYGNQSVIAMWHPGGYPDNPGPYPINPGGLNTDDCVQVSGLSEALCFAFRSDNQGPPESVEEILAQYEVLRAEFPNAKLVASTLENFVQVVYPLKSRLPDVTSEIGDTWIQGIQSDPMKVKQMKSFMRLRAKCINEGDCKLSDAHFFNSSRLLVKTAEHTWGRNGVSDYINWTNVAFQQVRDNPEFVNATKSWVAQRHFTYLALDALSDQKLANEIVYDWISSTAWKPQLKGYNLTDERTFTCENNLTLEFSADGYIQSLTDMITQVTYRGDLGRLEYRTYNQSDFDQMDKQYTYKTWFRLGVEKPNITDNAHPDSRFWATKLDHFYRKGGSCDFYARLSMVESEAHSYYGAPDEYWIHYATRTEPRQGEKGLDVTVQYFNKPPTRLPEALFYSFRPMATRRRDPELDKLSSEHATKWYYQKLGRLVDPDDVVTNGSKRLHAVDEGIVYYDPAQNSALEILSQDVALVSTITRAQNATVFPLPLDGQEPVTGSSFNFFNNIWNVNYIFWYPFLDTWQDVNFLARFSLNIINFENLRSISKAKSGFKILADRKLANRKLAENRGTDRRNSVLKYIRRFRAAHERL